MTSQSPITSAEDLIRTCVSEALLIDPSEFTMESALIQDLNAESIDLLDIRFRMEHAFGIKFRQEELVASLGEAADVQELRKKLTVGSLVRFVESRLSLKQDT